VRGIHFRNQPIRVLKRYKDNISRVIGYDMDKDFPLEIWQIPKVYQNIEKLGNLLNTFDAYKQLIFSKYFINYLGFDTVNDPDYNLYFMELNKNKNLLELQEKANYRITYKLSI